MPGRDDIKDGQQHARYATAGCSGRRSNASTLRGEGKESVYCPAYLFQPGCNDVRAAVFLHRRVYMSEASRNIARRTCWSMACYIRRRFVPWPTCSRSVRSQILTYFACARLVLHTKMSITWTCSGRHVAELVVHRDGTTCIENQRKPPPFTK
jgi:hypothetical protein